MAARISVLCLLFAVSCADTPPPEVHTPTPDVAQTVNAPPIAASPVLPPLVRDDRAPCDVARSRRARAVELLGKGRATRSLGEIAAADRICAASAAEGWSTKLSALLSVGRSEEARDLAKQILDAPSSNADAKQAARDVTSAVPTTPGTGAALLGNAQTAKAGGDAAGARKLFDQALVQLEKVSSAKPSIVWGREAGKALTLSADGTMAVLALQATAVLVDAAHLTPLRFFDHDHDVVFATFSHDLHLLATIDASGDAFLWATATGKKLHRLAWNGERAKLAVFTPDQKQLIVLASPGGFDSAVRIWSADSGDSVAAFALEASQPTSLALSHDGKLAAFGSERGHLDLWSLAPKPKQIFALAKKESFLESSLGLAFSPKGDRLAGSFANGTTTVWDTASGKPVWSASTSAFFLKISGYTFSADGKRLLAACQESSNTPSLRVWDASTGTELQNGKITGRAMAFSEDAKRGLLEGSDSVALLDVPAMSNLSSRATDVSIVATLIFGPPRVLVVPMKGDESLRVLVPTGLRSLPVGDALKFIVAASEKKMAPSFDGKEMAVANAEDVTLWDLETVAPREHLKIPFYPGSIALAPDRTLRATETFRDVVIVANDAHRDGWKRTFARPRTPATFPMIALSDFGDRALFIQDNEVTVVDTDLGTTHPIVHGLSRVSFVSITSDGRIVLIFGDAAIHRFDARTGARIGLPFPLGCEARSPPTFSFDGSRVVVMCRPGARLITFGERADQVTSTTIPLGEDVVHIALAPHGDLLAIAGGDSRVRLLRSSDARPLGDARFLPGKDAALIQAADGRIEILGAKSAELEQELWCRLGAEAYPFDLCRDAMVDEGVLGEIFAAP